jgi:hypothetical protein
MARSLWWDHHRLLRPGARGQDVRKLQQALNGWLSEQREPTDVFDQNTEQRVKEFQRLADLVEDGKVGPITHSVLFESPFEFAIDRPPVVLQSQNTCWAACLESVLRSSWRGREKLTVAQLRQKYRRFIDGKGAISGRGYHQVLKDLRASSRQFLSSELRVEKVLAFVRDRKFQVLLGENIAGASLGHVQVIYGVKVTEGQPELLVMDPLKGWTTLNFSLVLGATNVRMLSAPVTHDILEKEL